MVSDTSRVGSGRGRTARVRPLKCASAVSLAVCLMVLTACKTSGDAKAAATQLTATAKSLTDYYGALHAEAVATDQLNTLDQAVLGVPYDAPTRAQILDTAAVLEQRAKIASDLSGLADSFSKLTGSTAGAEVSASADKLQAEVQSLKLFPGTMSSPEQAVMNDALKGLTTVVQEHKERAVARSIAKFSASLPRFFAGEEDACLSVHQQYVGLSKSLAGWFLRNGQADTPVNPADIVKVALDPYGLTPKVSDADLQKKLAALAPMQVDQKAAQMIADQANATRAMEASLLEMSKRIDLVASDKGLPDHLPPPSLATVNQWASTILGK